MHDIIQATDRYGAPLIFPFGAPENRDSIYLLGWPVVITDAAGVPRLLPRHPLDIAPRPAMPRYLDITLN